MRSSARLPPLPVLSRSRISPPSGPKILSRPRLLDLFNQNEEKKLFLIIAQAAQGKSTVAAAWYARDNGRPSAWINLEAEDSDPVNLYYLLVRALHQERKEKKTTALLSLPSQALGPREDRYRYREWALALFETFNGPFQLFIDGLDRLTPQGESFRFLQVLIENMPPATCFILMSRAYPPLSLEFQNLKMGRQALVLKNEDLAFTPSEIKQYAREFHDLSLNAEQVERIYTATEGWIGGIILLIESLVKLPPDSIQRLLTRGLPDRFQRETFQYFGKEAFSALTLPHQKFLLQTSILDRLEPGTIRDLFPEADGQALLKELTRKNLFVQAFPDPKMDVIFRYHRLFKDFLGALLRSKLSPEEIRELLAKAGAYYREIDPACFWEWVY